MPQCGAQFTGYHREVGRRGVATRGPLCPSSYTDRDGFRLCRGLRMTGRCPRGLGHQSGELEATRMDTPEEVE